MTEPDNLALEYVLGTLRGKEKGQFVTRLENEPDLVDEVNFWEARLISLHQTTRPIEPLNKTWQAIESRISSPSKVKSAKWQRFFTHGWQWLASSALTVMICIGLWFSYAPTPTTAPTSYVAVMTDSGGAAILTALAPMGEKSLWLQWESKINLDTDTNLQLWAVSKTDANVRRLAVFDTVGLNQLAIGKTQWGLIKDAEYLILTEEKTGGSAIDRPSELIVAKGLCIQFHPNRES